MTCNAFVILPDYAEYSKKAGVGNLYPVLIHYYNFTFLENQSTYSENKNKIRSIVSMRKSHTGEFAER